MTKKVAWLGMLIALAFVFSYIESLIPIQLGVPGAKLGLSNLVVMVALYTLDDKYAFALAVVRIILNGFAFGGMAAMIYSLAGGMMSFAVMVGVRRIGRSSAPETGAHKVSVLGVSVLGGVFHNVGQIIAAMLVLETPGLIYYLPVLAVCGTASGTAIGVLAAMVIRRVGKVVKL